MEVYKSEWSSWKHDKVTLFVIENLMKYRLGKLEEIAHGHTNGLEELYTEIGRAQGIEDTLHFIVEDIKEELVDDEKEIENA